MTPWVPVTSLKKKKREEKKSLCPLPADTQYWIQNRVTARQIAFRKGKIRRPSGWSVVHFQEWKLSGGALWGPPAQQRRTFLSRPWIHSRSLFLCLLLSLIYPWSLLPWLEVLIFSVHVKWVIVKSTLFGTAFETCCLLVQVWGAKTSSIIMG